ncbi:MAG: DUF58 domain-containing protein, partial [Gemmatimonas sp.]
MPGRRSLLLVVAATVAALGALLAGVSSQLVIAVTAAVLLSLIALSAVDFGLSRRSWRRSNVRLVRRLPPAFAIGVERSVHVVIEVGDGFDWQAEVYDHVDPSLVVAGLPASVTLPAGKRVEVEYRVTPTRRGEVAFAPAELRVGSCFGLLELDVRAGETEVRRVYPDFAQIARYAWLAGDRRLQEIGIKTYQRRGEGTDFKQLAEYRYGDSVRHIDWKASLRFDKPIVREFQDERDQCVMLLIDCGRRMRADDRQTGVGTTHFDQVLNAVMLLAYVALGQGDAVGALTFGTSPEAQRMLAPRKGGHTLNALMAQLYGLQPAPHHADYVIAAQDVLRRQHKRALVILITDFRDEDGGELGLALRLLRQRHLVLLASVRERIVSELIAQ